MATLALAALLLGSAESAADPGAISGHVRDASANPLAGVDVDIFEAAPPNLLSAHCVTDATGAYDTATTGVDLPAGNYLAFTFSQWRYPGVHYDEVYQDVVCVPSYCETGAATPVVVAAGATTPNIDFGLSPPWAAPTVSTVTPSVGLTSGAAPVTVTGTGFRAGAEILFGGVAGTGPSVGSASSATVTPPDHAAGVVDVVVRNVDLRFGTRTNGYTFVTPSGDFDSDGTPNSGDCAMADGSLWSVPGNAVLGLAPGGSLSWTAPSAPGGTSVRYDVLRSGSPTAFGDSGATTCLATNVTATALSDASNPASIYFYLVVERNGCGRNAGADTSGTPRSIRTCP